MWSNRLSQLVRNKVKPLVSRTLSTLPKASQIPDQIDVHNFKVGDIYHGFQVKDVRNVSEFRITAIHLIHDKTKAEYLHLFRNDNNNVFAIKFRTTPMNSSGLPHILEHTVLCGSQLFPVADPFFKMLNRSLATFMNAMTAPDSTMYPFSTQNYSDYRNLQKIYLDAVFRPNLKEVDFMQEGWRLEFTDPNDHSSPLMIKGVVYNEMKGVFSDNQQIYFQKLINSILPDHTYGIVYGGDPLVIPELTWDDLKKFHAEHYHPSNSKFYSYGNFNLLPSLEYINSEYLDKYSCQGADHTLIPNQKRWSNEKTEHIPCKIDTMALPADKQNTISISLLMSDITNYYDTFLLEFLTEVLIKGPNSPFYKSMIEPNFSGGYIPLTGFANFTRDAFFTIGLQNLKQEDFPKVIELFNSTIDQVIEEGFEKNHLESVLHRYELSLKHETSNFGLNLMYGIGSPWTHTSNVIEALEVSKLMNRLREEIKNDPKYLQGVVRKFFKDNKHRLILSMSPDENFVKNLEQKEAKLLKSKVKNLSEEDKKVIYDKGLLLLKQQSTPQDTNILPTLVVEDIVEDVERIPVEHSTIQTVPTQVNQVISNGVVYFKSLLNILELSQEQQMILPLFCSVINKMGTSQLNYREFDNLVNNNTAGLSFKTYIGESLYHLHTYEPSILLSSYCLEKNVDKMFDLWAQLFNITEFKDVERFKTLVQLYTSNLTHAITHSGHSYAMQAAAGLVSGSAYQTELLTGLHHISYMKRLVKTSNYEAMLTEISNIANILFDKSKMRACLNLSSEHQSPVLKSYDNFLNGLPSNSNPLQQSTEGSYATGKVWALTDAINCEHHVLNSSVNFCSKAVLTVPYTDPDYAKLRVLTKLLSSKYLHNEIREKQGAYGGGAKFAKDGVFSFYSYRDPNNFKTLDTFDNSFKWMQKEMDKQTEQDVFEAKLGVFKEVDAPQTPEVKGCSEFLLRITPDILQRHRAELLAVNKNSLMEVGEKYLTEKNVSKTGKVILGPKNDKLDFSKRQDELWTVVDNE